MTRRSTSRLRYDTVIVGARCAGAATAMLLARQGQRVLVVDRDRQGADTLSTHALMRAGVLQLHRWGLLPAVRAAGTPRIDTTTFCYGGRTVEIPITPRGGVDGLYAPRRTVLDALLSRAAAESGAEVVFGVRLSDLMRDPSGRVRGAVIEDRAGERMAIGADLVIGADGAVSTTARLAGAKTYRVRHNASGVIYAYWSGLDVADYRWYYRPGVSAGAIPTNDGLTCLFVSEAAERFMASHRLDLGASYRTLLLEAAPELAPALAGARRVGGFRGFAGRQSFLRSAWGPGWALVGDAGYFKDPITAHGISDALRDAELLARSVARGESRGLDRYQAWRDELSVRLLDVTDAIASYRWTMSTLERCHRTLSEEMQREVAWLDRLDGPDDLDGVIPVHGLDGAGRPYGKDDLTLLDHLGRSDRVEPIAALSSGAEPCPSR